MAPGLDSVNHSVVLISVVITVIKHWTKLPKEEGPSLFHNFQKVESFAGVRTCWHSPQWECVTAVLYIMGTKKQMTWVRAR